MMRAFDSRTAAASGQGQKEGAVRGAFRRGRLAHDVTGFRTLVTHRGGAAMVEFAMAIMPVLCLFFGMVQWTLCAYANLIVQHAAYVAARADAVELPGMPDNGSEHGTTKNLVTAVTPLFLHVPGAFSLAGLGTLNTKLMTQPANSCDQTVDTVQVSLLYQCTIPLGNAIACGGTSTEGLIGPLTGLYSIKLTGTASFPNQGSYYQKVWNSKIGGSNSGCTASGS